MVAKKIGTTMIAMSLAGMALVLVAPTVSADKCTSALVSTNCAHQCRTVWDGTAWKEVCETCSYSAAGVCAADLNYIRLVQIEDSVKVAT